MSFAFEQRMFERLKARLAGIPNEGVSIHPPRVDFLPEASAQQRLDGTALVEGHDTLDIQTNKTTITADDIDTATLTLSSGVSVTYNIYNSTDGIDFWGTLNPSGGVISAPFKTPLADTYTIEILAGTASGYIQIEAL
jgi:hypothetical protein